MSYWYLLFPVTAMLLLCFSAGVCMRAFRKKGRFNDFEYVFWRSMLRWSVKSGHLKEGLKHPVAKLKKNIQANSPAPLSSD